MHVALHRVKLELKVLWENVELGCILETLILVPERCYNLFDKLIRQYMLMVYARRAQF